MKSAFVVSAVVVSLLGCGMLKKKGTPDAGADDLASVADAATVMVSGTGAKNEADILRYATETPLANVPAVIGKDGTVARNFPGNGPEVKTLAKGTAVAKIAQYFSTATLVMFDDPSGDGSKLLGWVPAQAFDVSAPPPVKPVYVPPRIVDAGSSPATVRDAGGGAVATVDAGAAKHDAGVAGPPAPARGVIAAPPVDGKCPWDGWLLTEGMCRHKCTADAECPRGTKCVAKKGAPQKVCSSG